MISQDGPQSQLLHLFKVLWANQLNQYINEPEDILRSTNYMSLGPFGVMNATIFRPIPSCVSTVPPLNFENLHPGLDFQH